MVYRLRLNYAFRTGTLTGVAGRQSVYLQARLTPDHVNAWEHQQEFRPGLWASTDYVFTPPGGSDSRGRVLHLSRPGRRPLGVRSSELTCDATDLDRALFIDDGAGGCFIHGWPPCRCQRCIVVPHGIGGLLSAVGGDGTLTIAP